MRKFISQHWVYFFRLAFWVAVVGILYLSLMPASSAPSLSWSDKINHILAFFVLGVLLPPSHHIRYWWALLLLVGFGILIEVLQHTVSDRSAELGDVIADAVGAIVGLVLYWCLHKIATR